MKSKHCPECDQDLPRDQFNSTRAKFCNQCKRIRELKQANELRERTIRRLKTKKPKTKVLKSLRELQKRTQVVFNAWIRERDKDLPCISCGQHKDKYHAGHYIAQGFSGFLKYNEDNCNKQCVGCNLFKRGNLIEYRIALVKKIGQDRVEWLENNRHQVKKWTREELEELIARYK